jgi:hypothetical protein
MHDQATQLTPEQHWNLQCHGVHQANEGITRTRNSGLRYIRRLIAGKVTSDSARQFTAAKLAAALKPIALPKFPSSQRAPRTAPTTPRKPTSNDRHSDYAHCVEAVNHVNPVNFVDFAPAPPLAPLPPEPPKPIDPAEIPDLTAQVAKLEDLVAAHLRQLGWDRTGSTVAENPATREYLRNRADDTEFRYLPELRQELAETKDRLEQSIALRDSLAATNPTVNEPSATEPVQAAPIAAAPSTHAAAPVANATAAATTTPAPATAPTAAEPAATQSSEAALPTDPADPEAIAREAVALKEEWDTLEDLRFGIGNELIALQRRKRHESHTPAWAAQAQDLFDRCVREKLDPTVMRQYTISQRLAQLGHKLE